MPLTLYELAPSPNNVKIRIALGLKGIPYERKEVPFAGPEADRMRSVICSISGQPLTPTLDLNGVRIFDSAACLRFIEANFLDQGPRLFSEDRDEMRAIEEWEGFGRRQAIQPVGLVINQMFSGQINDAATKQANELMRENGAKIEAQLAKTKFLCGDRITAADITTAPSIFYGMLPESVAAALPPAAFLRERLHLGDDRDLTRAWVASVMKYDEGMVAPA